MFLESQGDTIGQLPIDESEGFKGLLDPEAEGDGVWHHGLDGVMVKVADNAAVLFRVKAAGSFEGWWVLAKKDVHNGNQANHACRPLVPTETVVNP